MPAKRQPNKQPNKENENDQDKEDNLTNAETPKDKGKRTASEIGGSSTSTSGSQAAGELGDEGEGDIRPRRSRRIAASPSTGGSPRRSIAGDLEQAELQSPGACSQTSSSSASSPQGASPQGSSPQGGASPQQDQTNNNEAQQRFLGFLGLYRAATPVAPQQVATPIVQTPAAVAVQPAAPAVQPPAVVTTTQQQPIPRPMW
jgi:hypothetical protein